MNTLSRRWTGSSNTLLFIIGMVIAALGMSALISIGEIRLAVTAAVLSLLLGLALLNIRLAIVGVFVYLTVLGDLRRMLVPMVGWSGSDPLILVGPLVALLLFGGAMLSKQLSIRSPVAKITVLFMGFMALQIFNPAQGGLIVGVAGAMLYLVPMLWFWIGQAFATKNLMRTWYYQIMPALALLAAGVGLYQVFYGWFPYQLAWYRIAGYTALGPSEELLRSISIFPNLTEYLHYLGVAIIAGIAALFKKTQSICVLLIPVLLAALFLAGSRGPIVMVVLTAGILYTVQGRSFATWIPRLALTLFVGGAVLVYGLTQAGDLSSELSNKRMSHVLDRQAQLLPSEGADGGTVAIHGNLFWLGLKWGFEEPLGRGIGSTTLAASKYGDRGGSTEKDLSDMFVAGGVVGGFLYLSLIVAVATTALLYWRRERSLLALAFVGLLAFTGLSWLKPGHYVLTPLIWFTIGALDRFSTNRTETTEPEASSEDLARSSA